MTPTTIIIDMVAKANPGREWSTIPRRLWKLLEELGEVANAYLHTDTPYKHSTIEDLREEVVDVLIVAIDVALTPQAGGTPESVQKFITNFIEGRNSYFVDRQAPYWRKPDFETAIWSVANYAYQAHQNAGWTVLPALATEAFQAVLGVYIDVEQPWPEIITSVQRKLTKWADNRRSGRVNTDAE